MNEFNREEREVVDRNPSEARQSSSRRRDFLRWGGAGLLALPLLRATGAQAQTTAPVVLRLVVFQN